MKFHVKILKYPRRPIFLKYQKLLFAVFVVIISGTGRMDRYGISVRTRPNFSGRIDSVFT